MASYESFVRGEDFPGLVRGDGVLGLLDVNLPISGFIHLVRESGHTVTPVIWAGAGASAHVTTDAYERTAGEIVEAAIANGEVDLIEWLPAEQYAALKSNPKIEFANLVPKGS